MNFRIVILLLVGVLTFVSCQTVSTDSPLITEETAETVKELGGIEGSFEASDTAVLIVQRSTYEESQGLAKSKDSLSYLIFSAVDPPKELRLKSIKPGVYLAQFKGDKSDKNAYEYTYLYLRVMADGKEKKFGVYGIDPKLIEDNPPPFKFENVKGSIRFDAVTSIRKRKELIALLEEVEGEMFKVIQKNKPLFLDPISSELRDAIWKVKRKEKQESEYWAQKRRDQEVKGITVGAWMVLDTGKGVIGHEDVRVVQIRNEEPRVLVSVIETQEAKWVKPTDLKSVSKADSDELEAVGKVLESLFKR